MSYELKSITPENQLLIIEKSKSIREIEVNFSLLRRDGGFPENWAVNSEDGSFLVLMPSVLMPENLNIRYVFYFDGMMLELIGRQSYAHFMDIEIPAEKLLDLESRKTIREAISSAFNVYGQLGEGPFNKRGIPEFKVDARFENGDSK